MGILSHNRKPFDEPPVYIDGIPYRRLSDDRPTSSLFGFGKSFTYEAVDPFGNQVIVLYGPQIVPGLLDPKYLPKSSLDTLRTYHPEMAEQLDTDLWWEGESPGGHRVSDDRNNLSDSTWFVSTTIWRKGKDGYRLVERNNRVTGGGRVSDELDMHRRAGRSIEWFDGVSFETAKGYNVRWYDGEFNRWFVEEYRAGKVLRDMDRLFGAKPSPREGMPGGVTHVAQKNIRGRGRR